MSFPDGLTLLDASAGPLASAGAGRDGWVKIVPRGRFTTRDGRQMEVSPETLLARFTADGVDIPVDIDHAVAKKTIFGESAPAVGWITRMEARADGLYGFAIWLEQGRATLAAQTHRYISPTLKLDGSNVATWLHSVSVVAAPALSMPTVAAATPSHLETLGSNAMIIKPEVLNAAFRGFNTAFNAGFDGAASFKDVVAMTVKSQTGEETYPFLGSWPQLREWVGDRHVHGLKAHGFSIRNKLFESTVTIPRTEIEDDKIGLYRPRFQEEGRTTKQHPDLMIFGLLKTGFTSPCYDGQNFFDAEHPVGYDGDVASASNMQAGDGPAWYLIDGSRAMKPMIWQERVPYTFTTLEDDKNDRVFWRDEYVYGVRARVNCGFGLWQLAFGSKADLTPENYALARTAMTTLKSDNGLTMGIQPTHLIIPTALEAKARKLLFADQIEGTSNVWKGTAELVMTPFLD